MSFGVGKAKYRDPKLKHRLIIKPARVLGIILDDKIYPNAFQAHGKWGSLGGILFEFSDTPLDTSNIEQAPFALPLFANIKNYPVKNEIVTIAVSADVDINKNSNSFTYYYFPPINIWTGINHNAILNEINSNQNSPDSQRKSYREVELGSDNKVSRQGTQAQFDNNFEEKGNIRSIPYFIGDVNLEGRWGNSLRIGSTNNTSLPNTWSSSGKQGDAIIILRNGQFESTTEPWIPLSEDISLDKSSIYLTSTQKLPFPSYPEYSVDSFNNINPPTNLTEYNKPQIVLLSDKLTLFSRDLLVANSPIIHLNTNRFNVDTTGEITLQGSRINLGSGNPVDLQPALKGDSTQKLLNDMIDILQQLLLACETAETPSGPVVSLKTFATLYKAKIQALSTSTIKSEDTFLV